MSIHRSKAFVGLFLLVGLLVNCDRLAAQSAGSRTASVLEQFKQKISDLDMDLEKLALATQVSESRLKDAKVHLGQLQKKRFELLNQQNAMGVSAASYDDIMRLLQTQKVQLTIELAGVEARREAMIEQHEAGQKSRMEKSGPALSALKELSDIQSERLQQAEALHKTGSVPRAEVLDAKQQLLEVQIRLNEMLQAAGLDGPPAADQALLSLSLVRAETVARLNKVNQLLEEYVSARTPIDSLGRVTAEINAVEVSLATLTAEIRQHEDQLAETQLRRSLLMEKLKQSQDENDRDN